jgi:hypothetical protein
MFKINNIRCKYKNVDNIADVTQTYTWIEFSDVPLFTRMPIEQTDHVTAMVITDFEKWRSEECSFLCSGVWKVFGLSFILILLFLYHNKLYITRTTLFREYSNVPVLLWPTPVFTLNMYFHIPHSTFHIPGF